MLATTDEIAGKRIVTTIGLVRGNTVRAKHLGKDIGAFLHNIAGGELGAYTELLSDARDEAISRMVAEAEKKGANAIVGIRFTTASIVQGAAEILVYGTAVVV